MSKAVVTGVGCVSALGRGVDEFWKHLERGDTGIRDIRSFETRGCRTAKAGEVLLSDAELESARRLGCRSRWDWFGHLAVSEALSSLGFEGRSVPWGRGQRVGLVLGVSLGMSLVKESLVPAEAPVPSAETMYDFSVLLDELADRLDITGEIVLVTTACASGTHAIGIAKDMIVHEGYDSVVCGGIDTLDRMKYLGHSALSTLTTELLAPFTEHRSGTLFGEGAAVLILEADATAATRPRRFAECTGAAYTCDAQHVTAPDETGAGALEVMRAALEDAGLEPDEVDYINLHGSGTVANDAMESLAIQALFSEAEKRPAVSSIKPSVGHTMGAAGALEAVATVLAIHHGLVPPTANVKSSECAFPLDLVCERAQARDLRHALSTSFGFGGSNGAVVFSRAEP
jgi:3-oxoacyl-[acyl-carrier-protein] synthase II